MSLLEGLMNPPLYFGLPSAHQAITIFPEREPPDYSYRCCRRCGWAIWRGTPSDVVRPCWTWNIASGGRFSLCRRCYLAMKTLIEAAAAATPAPSSPAAVILLASRVSFLRHLAEVKGHWASIKCGWCSGMHNGDELAREQHDECRRQMARWVAVAASEESRAVFINALPLPVDLQDIIRGVAVALCDARRSARAAADLLLSARGAN